MVGVEWIEESLAELRCWVNFAIGVLQFICEGNRPDTPQGSPIDKSLFLVFQQPNFPG